MYQEISEEDEDGEESDSFTDEFESYLDIEVNQSTKPSFHKTGVLPLPHFSLVVTLNNPFFYNSNFLRPIGFPGNILRKYKFTIN